MFGFESKKNFRENRNENIWENMCHEINELLINGKSCLFQRLVFHKLFWLCEYDGCVVQ